MKSLDEAPIGSVVFERTEQYEAVVTTHQVHRNGCHRVVLQERRLKDGKPAARESVDIQTVEVRRRGEGGVIDVEAANRVLGLRARDWTSGYTGEICVVGSEPAGGRSFLLQSAGRTSAGDRVEAVWVDELFVELMESERTVEEARAKAPGLTGSIDCGPRGTSQV